MMKRTLIISAPLLLLFVEAMSVTQVSAHAAYDHSTPARDEVLQAAPTKVDVYFKQEVLKQQGQYYVRVFDDNGQVTDDGIVDDDDRTHISATLPADLKNGRYIVQWMTTSFEDGDPAEGAFCFYVGVEPTAAQQEECASFSTEATATQPATAAAGSPTAVATATAAPAPTPTEAASSSGGGSGAPVAAIIGGVIAGAVVLAIVAGGVFVWLRRMLE